ncbi:ATP-dependent RNA helicase ddx24 [Mactra antiquata]
MASKFHVKAKSKWKPVDISQAGIPQKDLDSFISFEELTDYEIITSEKKTPQKKKKIGTEQKGNVGNEKQNSPKKKKKKRIKKKNISDVDDDTNKTGSQTGKKETLKKQKDKKKKKDKRKNENKSIVQSNLQKIEDINEIMEKGEDLTDNISKQSLIEKGKKKRKAQDSQQDASPKKKAKMEENETDKKADHQPIEKSSKGMTGWKDLYVPDKVLWALKDQGFYTPTPIQCQILPSAIRDRMDVVGAAETGSGKTLAFGIPVLHFILQQKIKQAARLSQSKEEETVNSDTEDIDIDNDSNDDDNSEAIADDNNDNDDNDNNDGDENNGDGDNDDDGGDDDDDISDLEWEDETDIKKLVDDGNINGDDDDDNDDDGDSGNHGSSDVESSDEEIEDINPTGIGCVKVIKDIDFDWLNQAPATVKPSTVLTHPRALILEPTRELAIQVKNHLTTAAKYTDIKIAAIVGGLALPKQQRILKKCPDILVATPGRLWELIQQGEVFVSEIEKTNILVIDEADRMIEKGHFEELEKLLEKMASNPRKQSRHTYVFSATLTLIHSGPQRIMKKKQQKLDEKQKLELLMKKVGLKSKPKVVDITRKVGTVDTLTEARIHCTKEEKDIYLYYFLKHYRGRTLVFANSKDCIRRLVSIFQLLECNPLPLHADMHQRQRLKNLERFTSNSNALLMASDVAARGLDIPNVQHVIHYQVPLTVENYVHRSGRTARASKEGLSVMIVGPDDTRNYKKIMHTLNKSEDLPLFPVEQQLLTELRRRVNMVRKIETQEYRFKKSKRQNDWFKKAADEIGVDIEDQGLLEDLGDDVEQARYKQYIKQMKSELSIILKQPLQTQFTHTKYPTKTGKLVAPKSDDTLGDATFNVKKSKKNHEELVKKSDIDKNIIKKQKSNKKPFFRQRMKRKGNKKTPSG